MKNWVFSLCLVFGVVSVATLFISNSAVDDAKDELAAEEEALVISKTALEENEQKADANVRQLNALETNPDEVGQAALDTVKPLIDVVEANQSKLLDERLDAIRLDGEPYIKAEAINGDSFGVMYIPEEYDLVINTSRSRYMSVLLIDTTDDGLNNYEFEYDAIAKKVSAVHRFNIRS